MGNIAGCTLRFLLPDRIWRFLRLLFRLLVFPRMVLLGLPVLLDFLVRVPLVLRVLPSPRVRRDRILEGSMDLLVRRASLVPVVHQGLLAHQALVEVAAEAALIQAAVHGIYVPVRNSHMI